MPRLFSLEALYYIVGLVCVSGGVGSLLSSEQWGFIVFGSGLMLLAIREIYHQDKE